MAGLRVVAGRPSRVLWRSRRPPKSCIRKRDGADQKRCRMAFPALVGDAPGLRKAFVGSRGCGKRAGLSRVLGSIFKYEESVAVVGKDCRERVNGLNAIVRRRGRGGEARWPLVAVLLIALAVAMVAPARGLATAQDASADSPSSSRRIPEALRFAHGLFSQRKFDLAAEEYQRFLDDDPEPADGDDARFGLAAARLFQGRYKDSRAAFQEFIRLAPNHPRARTAWYRLGELSYMLGDLPGAREALERFTADPDPHANLETAWTYLGDVRLGLDDPGAAREAYETSLKRFPKGRLADRARYGLGRSLAAIGETDAALDALEDLVDQGAADWLDKALLQIGKIELAAGRFDEAEKALARLAKAAPQSALATEAQLRRAEALMRLNRPDDAAALLRPLAADPSRALSTEAALNLAVIDLRRDRAEEALKTLDETLEREGESPLVPALLYRSAEALRALDRDDEARARFLKVAEADPADPWADDAWREAARLALEAGDNAEAVKLAAAFPEKFPGSPLGPEIRLIQARAAMALGEPKTAIDALESLVGAEAERGGAPPSAPADLLDKARYELALAHRAAGQGERADALLAGLAQTPGKATAADASFLLGQDHLEAGRFQEALDDLKRYLEAAPDGRVADHALAHETAAYIGLGNREEAAKALGQLAERFPQSSALPPARLRLAEAFAEADELDKAIDQFRALIDATASPSPQDLKERAEFGLARALVKAGDPAAAAPVFDAIIARAKDNAEASALALERAQAFEAAGEVEEAAAMYERVQTQYPKEAPALLAAMARVDLFAAAEPPNPAAAAEVLGKLLSADETRGRLEALGWSVDALLAEWGWTLADAGKPDEADKAFQELLEAFPNGQYAADARFNLAESANQRLDFDEVVKLLSPLVEPGNQGAPPVPDRLLPDVLYRLGRTQIELADWSAASKTLDRLIGEFPEAAHLREAQFLRAEAALRLDQFAEAEAALDALIDGDPSPTDPPNLVQVARERRLQALLGLNRWEDALEAADQLKTDIDDPAARDPVEFARGRALLGLGRPEEAREAFQAVIDSRKSGDLAAQAQLMRGETYFHEDRLREALKEFLKVDILYDAPRRQSAALLEAGKVYERLDQWAEAVETYDRLANRFPDDPLAAEAKDRRAAAVAKRGDEPKPANPSQEP